MENQTKTRMTILNYIKESLGYVKEFTRALIGNDENLISDIDNIPELEEYKNKNANDEVIQNDIEQLAKIQKALDKKKEQTRRTNMRERVKTSGSRVKEKQEIIKNMERE